MTSLTDFSATAIDDPSGDHSRSRLAQPGISLRSGSTSRVVTEPVMASATHTSVPVKKARSLPAGDHSGHGNGPATVGRAPASKRPGRLPALLVLYRKVKTPLSRSKA